MTGNCYINYRARLRRRGKLHRGELLGPAHFVCFDQHTPPRAGLAGEMSFEAGGQVERRASQVLEECRQMLQKVSEIGMFEAIEAGMFGDTVRSRTGGKGLEGVVRRDAGYTNPITERLSERLGVS